MQENVIKKRNKTPIAYGFGSYLRNILHLQGVKLEAALGSVEVCQQVASPAAEGQRLNSGHCRLEKYTLKPEHSQAGGRGL